jgi:nitroreductase
VTEHRATSEIGRAPVVIDDTASLDQVLATTKAARRRLDLDRPVNAELIQECLELAVYAPTANGRENWRWLVVTDANLRWKIAELYRAAWQVHSGALGAASARRSRGDHGKILRSRESADWLAANLHRVPVHVIACLVGRPPADGDGPTREGEHATEADGSARVSYLKKADARLVAASLYFGSIYPAIWSFQLALRSRGLGSAITVAHLAYESEIATLLGVPKLVTQIALLPVAHVTGTDFVPSSRTPASRVTYWDRWEKVR